MALITGFGLFIVSVLIAALSRTVAEEIEAWNPLVIRGLIKLAVGRLPEGQRERFDEEWQSHVSEVPGKVGKLLVAAGFLFASHKMALTGRRNRVIDSVSSSLAQVNEAHSLTILALELIQNDQTIPLSLREKVLARLSEISSLVTEGRDSLDQIAAHLAAASSVPWTLTAKLYFTLHYGAVLRRQADLLSQQAAQMRELNTKIVRLVDERKRLGSK